MSIKQRRLMALMTQRELAQAANISTLSVIRYESGERTPTLDIASKIAKALNCTVDELLKDQ